MFWLGCSLSLLFIMIIILPWLLAVKHCNLVTVIQRFYHFIATSELRFLSASSPEDPVLESRAITDLLREAGTLSEKHSYCFGKCWFFWAAP